MQTEREKKRKTVGLHCKQRLPWALHKVHMRCRPKKKKSSSHSQMATQSKANVKKTHMTARAPLKKSTAWITRWIYRWLYVQGDDGKPITNVSVSSYFQGQNNLCVLKQLQMMHSHLVGVFIFVVLKYRGIQNKHLCLFEIKSNLIANRTH